MKRIVGMTLITLLLASPVAAQETSSDSPKASAEAEDADRRDNRRFSIGLGPALVFWPPHPGDSSGDVSPGIAVEARNLYLVRGVLGFEWTNDVVFHDFKAMGDGYEWYFREPSEDDSVSQAVKLGVLWPGLILIPFGGANYTSGAGFIVYTSSTSPAAFFDIGAQLNLYLRLSDPDFRADFSIGAYGGAGFEFTDALSVSARLNWGTPLIHNIQNNTAGSIWTTIVTGNLAF